MNVGELLRERDRLLAVLEEAKSARTKLKQINVLIAMYGDAENVDLVSTNGHAMTAGGHDMTCEPRTCDECGDGPFNGERGVSAHKRRMHGTETAKSRAAQARKAAAARKAS